MSDEEELKKEPKALRGRIRDWQFVGKGKKVITLLLPTPVYHGRMVRTLFAYIEFLTKFRNAERLV